MSALALTTAQSVLALIGLALGVVVLGTVVLLFNSVLRPAKEIDAYASDILDHGVGIAKNLDAVDRLEETRGLATAVPGLAVAYLKKLGLA